MYAPLKPIEHGSQGDMIVAPDHRGHRLSTLVLAEGVLRLAEFHPWVKRVYTWNAEENAAALAVSTSVGFRPNSVNGEWQRKR
jgi:RimJ/RimL family protein N-acetyltransferase